MRAYHRLTEGERNQVYALKKVGFPQRAIADQIGVNKSTISREFKRNTGLRASLIQIVALHGLFTPVTNLAAPYLGYDVGWD